MHAPLLRAVLLLAPLDTEGALVWDAPVEGCPSSAELVGRLPQMERGVDYDHYRATVRYDGARWIAQLDGPSPRQLRGASCQELADAIVLLVELSMREAEAAAKAEQEDRIRAPTPPPEVPPTVDPAPTVSLGAAREPGPPNLVRAVDWGLSAGAGATFVVTPSIAAEVQLIAGPRGRRWSLDIGGLVRPGFAGSDPQRPDLDSTFSSWAALVRACGVPARRRIEVPMCGGVEIGAVIGRGTGNLAPARRAAAPWAAARVDVGVRIRASELFRPYVMATGLAPLARPQFSIGGVGSVWNAGPVGFAAHAGVELRLPAKTRGRGH